MTEEKKKNNLWNFLDNLEGDKVVWMIVLLLMLISIVAIFSSTSQLALQKGTSRMNIITQQMIITLLSLGLIVICYNIRSIGFFREVLRGPKGLSVVIDYAHTPDALDNVLKTLREIDRGKELICLFGCGGDRDRTKRPEMAAVAEKYSDRIVVTSDNSRTERTEDIIEEIKTGFSPKGLARTISLPDRKEAIRMAVMTAAPNAIILLAGKGHETYQILGTEKRHFDEREVVAEVFKQMETTE